MKPSDMPRVSAVAKARPQRHESAEDRLWADMQVDWARRDGLIPQGISADKAYRKALLKAGVR